MSHNSNRHTVYYYGYQKSTAAYAKTKKGKLKIAAVKDLKRQSSISDKRKTTKIRALLLGSNRFAPSSSAATVVVADADNGESNAHTQIAHKI
jgi:hypothetical protein